ncbi:hypothetical protein C1645_876128 [Glomus cerebriforme]|uniref:DNA topoisomerase (ATP-hydrolyzing) n=1 Tax=Glomus cerebriforme TaxID=658196 RepID=A0A397T5H5_9GLOM|nr:hypothetical protein C1645_876128 [Glomus cerebriforme]
MERRVRITGITKLNDANNAGGRNAKDCILIVTEEGQRELIDMAFNEKKADDRKEWLKNYEEGAFDLSAAEWDAFQHLTCLLLRANGNIAAAAFSVAVDH